MIGKRKHGNSAKKHIDEGEKHMAKEIYICCEEERRKKYERDAKSIYREAVVIVSEIENDVLVLAIQPITQEMERQIKDAKAHNIQVIYMTKRFIPEHLYEDILNNHETRSV